MTAVLLTACYSPSLTEGLPCSAMRRCPDGQSCDEATNRCFSAASLIDAAMTDADAGGGDRVVAGLVGRWDFQETSGTTVNDTSGVGTPLNLQINGAVTRITDAVRFDAGDGVVRSLAAATKIIDAARASGEVTVEAWFKPLDFLQSGPARIVGCSSGTTVRNFHIAQQLTQLEARLRNTATGLDGDMPTLDGGPLLPGLNHAVLVHHAGGGRDLYLNGIRVDADSTGGSLANWDSGFELIFGNETSLDRDWLGELHLVAIYDQALDQAGVSQNFNAGAMAP